MGGEGKSKHYSVAVCL